MLHAPLVDLAQRLLTLNKSEQRRNLAGRIKALGLEPGAKVLDFGCGTGLLAPTLLRARLAYHGFDVDTGAVAYARRLYRAGVFLVDRRKVEALGPYDLILAHTCFHHVSDEELDRETLPHLRSWLAPRGVFLMIDLLPVRAEDPWVCRIFRRIERGDFLRQRDHYRRLIGGHFRIENVDEYRSHVLSIPGSPLFGDLLVLTCR